MDWKLNTEAEPQGSSDGFWYDLTDGGCIKLDKLLLDVGQVQAARDAIDLLVSLKASLDKAELLLEF